VRVCALAVAGLIALACWSAVARSAHAGGGSFVRIGGGGGAHVVHGSRLGHHASHRYDYRGHGHGSHRHGFVHAAPLARSHFSARPFRAWTYRPGVVVVNPGWNASHRYGWSGHRGYGPRGCD
jgi:hypothetical protein